MGKQGKKSSSSANPEFLDSERTRKLLEAPPLEFIPYLQSVFVLKAFDSVLPEILKFIPRDKLQEFLTTFSGETVTFPSWAHLNSIVNDAWILWECKGSGDDFVSQRKVKKVAKLTGLTRKQVLLKVEHLSSQLPRL